MKAFAFLLLLCFQLPPPTSSASYHPLPSCIDSCNAIHMCTSCVYNSTSDPDIKALPLSSRCPAGFTPNGSSTKTPDRGNCHPTGCDNGNCGDDEVQVDERSCSTSPWGSCHVVFCKQKTCCASIDTVQCCQPVQCHPEYSSCQVPHQSSNISSLSSITQVTIAHNSSSVLPFYLSSHLEAASSCSSARVFGVCDCYDGVLVPTHPPGSL